MTTHARINNLRATLFFSSCDRSHTHPRHPRSLSGIYYPHRRSGEAETPARPVSFIIGPRVARPYPWLTGFAAHWQMPGALVYTGGTTDSGVSPLAAFLPTDSLSYLVN